MKSDFIEQAVQLYDEPSRDRPLWWSEPRRDFSYVHCERR